MRGNPIILEKVRLECDYVLFQKTANMKPGNINVCNVHPTTGHAHVVIEFNTRVPDGQKQKERNDKYGIMDTRLRNVFPRVHANSHDST